MSMRAVSLSHLECRPRLLVFIFSNPDAIIIIEARPEVRGPIRGQYSGHVICLSQSEAGDFVISNYHRQGETLQASHCTIGHSCDKEVKLWSRENVMNTVTNAYSDERVRGVILLNLYSINPSTTFNPVGVKTSFLLKPIH